ncbi:MAG: PQQ-dependent sugar dehydrogenase [Acidobacteriota bacterium]|nr:PQQ-dependent sugar dehydrogenase [Acidobacteriota bacterium]
MRAPVLFTTCWMLGVLVVGGAGGAQVANDPFPVPIETTEDVIVVGYDEFATLPDVDGAPARPMRLVDQPESGRLFVNDMYGPIYTVTYDGEVTLYLDVDDRDWGVPVEFTGRERGVQSFALHPQFGESGTDGYGRLYAWLDTRDTTPEPDFVSGGGQDAHDTVLIEFAARDASARTYDGGPPRVLLRVEQPFRNHNGGYMAFNPLVSTDDADFGMLYIGVADGGSGGDPLDLAQDLGRVFGKILRIDPLGSNSPNGRYGVPFDNPYVAAGPADTLAEIFASGLRNPQGLAWDPVNGNMFVTDIGQNIIEELSLVTSGADLGWNTWEGSYRFISRQEVGLSDPRSAPGVTFPIAEYGQLDPILQSRSAAGGALVYRDDAIPQLRGRILFADFPQGEIFHLPADDLPGGGQAAIRRVLLRDGTGVKTFIQVVAEKTVEQGREPAVRADLRFGRGPEGRLFLMNKHDGVIREVVP